MAIQSAAPVSRDPARAPGDRVSSAGDRVSSAGDPAPATRRAMRERSIDGARDALWMATAVPAPAFEPLGGDARCDVAIVGAGFTGLNAALRLARGGADVRVLEARHPGYGASGRSGGQINMGLNLLPSALIERFGRERGERLIRLVVGTPGTVRRTVEENGLDCDLAMKGWVQGAATPGMLRAQRRMAEDYAAHGGRFDVLDAPAFAAASGAEGYLGGLHCATAGSLHPLSYTRELARVAMAAGGAIHRDTPVTALSRQGTRWRLATPHGTVTAEHVVIATNGYTDALVPGLRERIVPVRSVLVASEPLPERVRATLMPGGVTFVDKRRITLYARYDRDGRLAIGDHGPMRDTFALADFKRLKRRARRTFPQLRDVRWDFHWGGRVAMTRASLPFLAELGPGLSAGMGYNGRGVGMATVMGRALAAHADGGDADAVGFPVTTPGAYPFHAFHPLGVWLGVRWFGLLDAVGRLRG